MTPEETLREHLERSRSGSEDEFLKSYREDSFLIRADGIFRGLEGVRASYHQLMDELPEARFEYRVVRVEENLGLVVWTAASEKGRVEDGVDSYLLGDGYIRAQTIRYTVLPADDEGG